MVTLYSELFPSFLFCLYMYLGGSQVLLSYSLGIKISYKLRNKGFCVGLFALFCFAFGFLLFCPTSQLI